MAHDRIDDIRLSHQFELGQISAELLDIDEKRDALKKRRDQIKAIIATIDHINTNTEPPDSGGQNIES